MVTKKLLFTEVAERFSDAHLNRAVLFAGYRGACGENWLTAAPSNTYVAIEEAGRLLRLNPTIRLAEEPVAEEVIERLPLQDVAARSLAQIVNTSIQRQDMTGLHFTPRHRTIYSVCDLSERFFASTLNFAATEESFLDNNVLGETQDGCQVITGRDNQPILLRKRRGQQSALSLTPITINGVVYPAGSLMRYDLRRDFDTNPDKPGRYENKPLYDAQQEVVPASEIDSISFLRMSAFALAVRERETFPLAPTDFPPLHRYEKDMLFLSFAGIAEIVRDVVRRQTVAHA